MRPLPRPLPEHSIRGGALLQMRQNGLDRVRVGDICDHSQRAAAQRTDRNIDIKHSVGQGYGDGYDLALLIKYLFKMVEE